MSSNIVASALSIIPPQQPITAVITSSLNTGNGSTWYTVPAGRTFYATGVVINYLSGGSTDLSIMVDGDEKIRYRIVPDVPLILFNNLFAASENQIVTLKNNFSSISVNATLIGFLL